MTELVWRAGLSEAEIEAVRAVAEAATAADGVAPLGEHVLLHLGRRGGTGNPAEAAHLLAYDGSQLTGIAHLDLTPAESPVADDPAAPGPHGSAELTVHPEHRRAGLGTALVRALLARAPGTGSLTLWAHGDHPGAAAIAARVGLRRVRELRQLRLTMTEPPPVQPLPAGVRIRAFRVGVDEPEFLRVNNAAFDWHPEQGGWGPSDIGLREREPWFDPGGFLLAVDPADRLLGYHWTKVHPATASVEPLGEVYVLGVDPAARGLHLGRTLTVAGLRHLYDRGLRTVLLYVEADNAAALAVYDGLGFTRWQTDLMYAR